LTVAQMSLDEMKLVVDLWVEQFRELGQVPWINHIEIFENRGAMMGASNPHPHCQLWANATIPNEPAKELQSQREYFLAKNRCLLCDYVEKERAAGERVIFENDGFVVLVPFWAVWPFETLVVSKRHVADMVEMDHGEHEHLADTLRRTAATYDRVFNAPFPYSMGFHQRPTNSALYPEWHFHAHYYPPLLRSATVRKFMVGYELLGSPQRDITPESAAARLRELIVPEWSG
jgi:UDPglucose--hexose-1-phosphate uridylyltransferase